MEHNRALRIEKDVNWRMAETHPTLMLCGGPIEVTLQEKLVLQRVELDAIHDIYRYIKLERLRGGHREASQ